MVVLRAIFHFGFSEVSGNPDYSASAVWDAWSIGLRFDLRLALLMMLPLAALAWFPRFNLLRSSAVRFVAHVYLLLALLLLVLTHFLDMGYYAYLVRLNVTALRSCGIPPSHPDGLGELPRSVDHSGLAYP